MADIVCPKCGKPNPAGSTTCRYCNSSLTSAANKPDVPIPPAGNAEDAPDWLSSLRSDTNAGTPWNEQSADQNAQAISPSDEDVPDWLQRIRERNEEGVEAGPQFGSDNSGQPSSADDQMPDWLNSTKSNESSAPSDNLALEDWLKKLRENEPTAESKPAQSNQPVVKPSLTQQNKPAAQPDDETSEWLKSLQTWKPSTPLFDNGLSNDQAGQVPLEPGSSDDKTSPLQPSAQGSSETPDWLKDISTPESNSAAPPQPSVPSDEIPTIGGHTGVTDWLRQMPGQSNADLASETPAPSPVPPDEIPTIAGHTGVTDWLRQMPGQSNTTTPSEPPTLEQPQDQSAPDLLSRIPEQPSTPPDEIPTIGGHTGVTDWLRHLGSQAGPATPPETPSNQAPASLDWLSDLRGQPEPSAPATPIPPQNVPPVQPEQEAAALPAEDTPDWLKSFAPSPAETAAPAQPVQSSQAAPAEEIPDWLKDISPNQAAAPLQPAHGSSSGPAEETPDWLKSFSSGPTEAAAPAQPAAAAAEETPDWLKSFTPSPQETGASAQPAAAADETPDWLKSFAPGQQETAAPADETPDWLKTFAPNPAEPAAPAQPVQETPAAAAEETPDWLKSFAPGPEQTASPAQSIPEIPAASAEETPDWLKSFAPGQPEQAAPVQENDVLERLQSVSPAPVDEISAHPDVASEPVHPASAAPAEAQPSSSDEVPDWLQNISGRTAAAEPSTARIPTPAASDNTPDWLQSFGSASSTAAPLDTASHAVQPSGQSAASENRADEEPDWLSKITNVIPPADQAAPPAVTPVTETGGAVLGEIPDWLSSIKPQEIPSQEEAGRSAFVLDNSSIELPASEEPGKNPFAGEGVPDWLSEVPQGAEAQAAQSSPADGSTEQLEPAQLPGWLQAMRPLEAVAPAAVQVDDQRVEKSGPLAGLKGILPGDDAVTQYRKPPSYSVKLKISEKQRASANLLEQMLGQESNPQAIPQDRVRIPQRLVRLVIALVLIAALLFPLLTSGAGLAPATVTAPANVVQFHTSLDAVPDGGQVLLAVDYDPGFAGEMHFAAAGVVERLIEKNENLVLVSTVPAGPVMAQNLISQILLDRPDLAAKYSANASVINLGYLPGGATSLQEFASAPRQATQYGFKAGVDATSPWFQPALQNIQDVSQFSMVMVLTDSLDSGRAWIEQVQPALKTAPLMMVVSAQAAPLIQPYVLSGQVKAMISGISGGTAYQQYLKTAVNSSQDWIAYTYGLLVLVALILLGIVLQIGTSLFSHRKSGG